MTHNLFVYGTLIHPEISKKIFDRKSDIKGRLHGYKRHKIFYKGEELFYPAIISSSNSFVDGILFTGLNDEEFEFIDNYEGDEYSRLKVSVEVEGKLIQCWCYIWNNNSEYELRGDWDLQEFSSKYLPDLLNKL